jgi:hypothetical protein
MDCAAWLYTVCCIQQDCEVFPCNIVQPSNVDPCLVLVGRLCAADECVFIVLSGQHNAAVGLQVEVLLATQADGALQHVVGSCSAYFEMCYIYVNDVLLKVISTQASWAPGRSAPGHPSGWPCNTWSAAAMQT